MRPGATPAEVDRSIASEPVRILGTVLATLPQQGSPLNGRVVRRCALIGIGVVAALWLGLASQRYIDGLSLVIRAADLHGVVRRMADLDTVAVTERLVVVPLREISVRARVYAPAGTPRQAVLVVSGLHPAGIDEPRLVALSRELAKSRVTVVTPEIPELSRFDIRPMVTDRIEQAAAWMATESGLAPSGRIGLMGISFSGGLSVVAAGRQSLRNHLLYVLSSGGHDDLRRVLEYSCTGIEGEARPHLRLELRAMTATGPPHDYGVAIALLNVADRMVPPDQITPLRDAVRRFLWASYLDRVDKPQAAREFAALRELARTLPQPAATLLEYVNNRDVAHLGPRLLPHIASYIDLPELSPSRSPRPSAPVFLLHGRDDNVIPSAESRHLADRLRGHLPVRLLVTDLISHAEADQPAHLIDVLKLAGFWGDLLAQ